MPGDEIQEAAMADEPAPASPALPTSPPTPPPAPVEPPLGEPGLRALQIERDARAEAERQAREYRRERDALTSQLSDADQAKVEAERQKQLANKAIRSLRTANLELALAGHGLTGPKAKAASKLIEGVEYDDDFRPVNLDHRIGAAKATYGDEFFANGVSNGHSTEPPAPTAVPAAALPEVHNGVRPSAPAADEEQQFQAVMNQFFPGALPPAS